MSRDESLPLRDVSAEEIRAAKERARAAEEAPAAEIPAIQAALDALDPPHDCPYARGDADECPDPLRHGSATISAAGARDLLAALRKERAEVERLRGIVEALAAEKPIVNVEGIDRDGDDFCFFCERPATADGICDHTVGCLRERAVAAVRALRPAGTLASLPVDSCDGDDR